MKANRRQVVWKKQDPGVVIAKRIVPAAYVPPSTAVNDNPSMMPQPGSAAMIIDGLNVAADVGVHPFPCLEKPRSRYKRAKTAFVPSFAIQPGTLVVYAGEVRSTESKRYRGKVHNVSVIKHTFITPAGRCIIHDLTTIRWI